MSRIVRISGRGLDRLHANWSEILSATDARALGIASAFVSVRGVERMLEVIERSRIRQCRLVTGTDYAITHPEALRLAQEASWQVRIARQPGGVFHPKLFVAGDRFLPGGGLNRVQAIYVGSGNLTQGGLQSNLECGLLSDEANERGASDAFRMIWRRSNLITPTQLEQYAEKFSITNRRRKAEELEALGITDGETPSAVPPQSLRTRPQPTIPAIRPNFAEAAWAGLESYTGGYRYQPEFPRDPGEAIRNIIGEEISPRGEVNVYCEDGIVRRMQYRFYQNSMFRLNVPNDVPNVEWAKQNRAGIAFVQRSSHPSATIDLRIYRPGPELDEIVRRSVALGTWGRTTTRSYGWF